VDIRACDHEKEHRDHNKYNVSHKIAPENRLVCHDHIASSMPAAPLENIGFSKQAGEQQVATCKNQSSNRCKLQDATGPSTSLTTPRKSPAYPPAC
jgi:hypothetical protein